MNTLQQEIKLTDLVEELTAKPFIIGETDCNMMALRVLKELSGFNAYDVLLNRYSTYLGGARVAKRLLGHKTMLELLRATDTTKEIDVNLATAGDIIVTKEKGYSACMVHLGNQVLVANDKSMTIELGHIDYDDLSDAVAFRALPMHK